MIRDKRSEHDKMIEEYEDKIKDLHIDLKKWKSDHDSHLDHHDNEKSKLSALKQRLEDDKRAKSREEKMKKI